MTDKMMHEALQAAISLYGGNTALGRLVRERGAVGVFEIAFEYGWRALKPKAQEGKDAGASTVADYHPGINGRALLFSEEMVPLFGEKDTGEPVFSISQIRDAYKAGAHSMGGDDAVMIMLSSIENRLMELAGGPGIERISGWLERITKDIYHVTTRQESIDIEQRRMISEILDLMRPTDEMVCGVDLASGPDITAAHFFDTETREATPLEDISDEMLDQMKEQIPVSVYVAEVSRRKQVQNVVKDERDVRIEDLQEKASTLEKQLHFYRLLAKSRAAALNAVYGELDSFEA
jgi:hypothetical protein